ncbi:MAG: hypothetical protein ACRD12_20665 [Acidimicrobiales bacterium]
MEPTAREPERRELVVVPHRPGPVIPLDDPSGARKPDELDELIDDLLPDTDERAGWLDAALLVLGAGLLAWAAVGDPPAFVVAVAVVALALGCILPMRAAWRGVRRRRDRRTLAKGLPLDVAAPVVRRLVDAYEAVRGFATDPAVGAAALSAAHGALMEVATLLDGRAPVSAADWSTSSRGPPPSRRSGRRCRRRRPRLGLPPVHASRHGRSWSGSPGSGRCPASMS